MKNIIVYGDIMTFEKDDRVKIKKTFKELYTSSSLLFPNKSAFNRYKGYEGTVVRRVDSVYYDVLWDDGYVSTVVHYVLELCENKQYKSVW